MEAGSRGTEGAAAPSKTGQSRQTDRQSRIWASPISSMKHLHPHCAVVL